MCECLGLTFKMNLCAKTDLAGEGAGSLLWCFLIACQQLLAQDLPEARYGS
jgi:hypothetical protein